MGTLLMNERYILWGGDAYGGLHTSIATMGNLNTILLPKWIAFSTDKIPYARISGTNE